MSDIALFGDNFTAAQVDFNQCVLFFLIATFVLCLCLAVPGTTLLQRVKALSILLLTLFFGATILLLQYCHDWETAKIETELTPHQYDISPDVINQSRSVVSVRLGLRGINITYDNEGDEQGRGQFHFNERFEWAWNQGRNDFGPHAGSFQRQYREGQLSGLPTAVLKVANVFTIDGEGFRHGRMYRIAGLHTHNLIWWAFIFWLTSVLCMQFSLTPSAYFLALSGATLLMANISWACFSPVLRSRPPVVLLGSAVLKLQLGTAFYLCLFTGLLAVVLAVALLIFEAKDPKKAAASFGLDPRSVFDEYYCNADEVEDFVNDGSNIPSTPVILKSDAVGNRKLSKAFSLDNAQPERVSLLRSTTIDGTTEKAKEQVLVLRRRNFPIPGNFFAERARHRSEPLTRLSCTADTPV